MLRSIRNPMSLFLTLCVLASSAVLGGCLGGDDDSGDPMGPGNPGNPGDPGEPQEIVLLLQTIQGPIAQAGTGFTPVGNFVAENGNDVHVEITSTDATSNVLINIALANGGFATNVAQFQAASANPAVATVTNPQVGQGNALRIADDFQLNATYTVRVTQLED